MLSSAMLKSVGSMSKYIVRLSTNLAHPLTLDWGHVILLSAQAKWLQRAQRFKKLENLEQLPMPGGLATRVLTVS
jgi:hypothetical protein